VLADHERLADLPVALPRGDQPQDLELAAREPAALAGRRLVREAREVGRGPELREDAARRLQLERRGILVAELPAGQADEDACPGVLVGRSELARDPLRPAKRRERRPGIAAGEPYRSAGVRGRRRKRPTLRAGCDGFELRGRALRLVDLPGG
jgi:hypothetical protein